jgi:hypothetical protein
MLRGKHCGCNIAVIWFAHVMLVGISLINLQIIEIIHLQDFPKICLTSLRITVPPVNICSVYMYNYCCVYSNLYWWNKLRQTIWVTLPSLSPRVARTSIILFQLPNAMHWLFPKALPYKKIVLTTK